MDCPRQDPSRPNMGYKPFPVAWGVTSAPQDHMEWEGQISNGKKKVLGRVKLRPNLFSFHKEEGVFSATFTCTAMDACKWAREGWSVCVLGVGQGSESITLPCSLAAWWSQ